MTRSLSNTRTQCNHAHLTPGMVKCPTCGKVFIAVHRFYAFKAFALAALAVKTYCDIIPDLGAWCGPALIDTTTGMLVMWLM